MYLLIVNFQHAQYDLELRLLILALHDTLEQLLTGYWDNALVDSIPDHGVGLSTARLAIGKEGAVVALPGIVQHSIA